MHHYKPLHISSFIISDILASGIVWTFIESFLGSIILLFVLFLNDNEQHYTYFYTAFFALFLLQTVITYAGRFIIINIARHHLTTGKFFFNTLIVGNSRKAYEAFKEIK